MNMATIDECCIQCTDESGEEGSLSQSLKQVARDMLAGNLAVHI